MRGYVAGMLILLAPASSGAAGPQMAKLQALVPEAFDSFGYSVAFAGDTAVIGAPSVPPYYGTPGQEAAYVFELAGGIWAQTAELYPSDGVQGDRFGWSVAVHRDTILVGAPRHHPWRGAVYVYERSSSGWSETQKLEAADPEVADHFGYAVALDEDRAVIGAPGWGCSILGESGYCDIGRVFFFDRSPAGWVQNGVFTGPQVIYTHPKLGHTVSISGDLAIAGATQLGGWLGWAQIFERQGATWTHGAMLFAGGPVGQNYFGSAVSISGTTALVSAPSDDGACPGAPGCDSGATHVFERTAAGWVEQAVLAASDAGPDTYFGGDLSLSGERAVITGDQALYVFERDAAGWKQVHKLLAADGPWIGSAVSLHRKAVLAGAVGAGTPGAGYVLLTEPTAGALLVGTSAVIGLAQGGAQALHLWAGPWHGGLPYLLLGSMSGGAGLGIPVYGLLLPLAVDHYLAFTLLHANTPPLSDSLGALDGAGEAKASFSLPPGSSPSLAGLSLEHAYLGFDASITKAVLVSNAVPLELVP